jgi:ankyrin repeat protein
MTEQRAHARAPAAELEPQGAYNGLTPLHDAVWHGHLEAARALVDAGHRLDLKTQAGLTPRELAMRYRYDDVAAFLAAVERP